MNINLKIINDALNGSKSYLDIKKTDLNTPEETAQMVLNTFADSKMGDPITVAGIEYLVLIKDDKHFNLYTGQGENVFGTGPCTIMYIFDLCSLEDVMPLLETIKLK